MDDSKPTQALARRAGLLYLLAAGGAPFAYLYVPDVLLAPGGALATADRVRASETLLRAAIIDELLGVTILLFAALALYQLFQRVDRKLATVMAAMMLVSVPISYVNVLLNIAPLVLLKTKAITAVLDPGQVAAQVTLFLRLHNYGLVVNQIFWGAWLIPIGMLVRRSGFIPGWLGIPLFFAGTGYVLNSLGTLVLPPSLRGITDGLLFLGVGEMPFFSFYLLIWGVRGYPADRLATLLALASFAIGMAAVVLLVSHRIDPSQYAGLALAHLVALFGMVMRWRQLSNSNTGIASMTAVTSGR